MWISYSDSEVNRFHPVCERALNSALQLLGKANSYKILHHQHTGTLEMDFVVQNIRTGKYLCVVEVKRTPADIHSARYQFQAMSYVQMNSGITEQPFYILTNLEQAFSFRYDPSRPRAYQQMLQPGLVTIGSFSQEESLFVEELTQYFSVQLNSFFNNEYEYLLTLEEFARHMEQIKNLPKKWKSHLAVLLYEYIRGAFSFINRQELPDVRIFHNDVMRICRAASQVNFKDIFTYSENAFESPVVIDNHMLSNLFDFGHQNVSGDSVAGILHQVVSEGHEHEGEVPTDLELAKFVSILAKNTNGTIGYDQYVCDPAAGSGNLISSAIDVFNLSPNQILVNDWNAKLLELLSLRLGLIFASEISHTNSPNIENKNIAALNREFFSSVKVIVMNPPFVAGINCVERKQEIYRALQDLTGDNYKTNVGQMPLEAVFLELVTYLVRPGTTIACVFPKTHLTARGVEAQIIRSMLISNLGLQTIFTYPGEEIFDDVTKDTCVLVGKAWQPSDTIKVISSYDKIPDLDSHRFQQVIQQELLDTFVTMMPGVVGRKVDKTELVRTVNDGWRMLNSEMVEGISFVKSTFEKADSFLQLKDFPYDIKRGCAANNGGSDLMFFDSRKDLYERFANRGVCLKAGMRNAKHSSFCVDMGDSKFLDIAANDDELIEEIIDAYLTLSARPTQQPKKTKSKLELKRILVRENENEFPGNSVLIPRAIRKEGKVYLAENSVFVSTNFVVCTTPTADTALLLATWMSTIFYQLICEVASKDQEGMRKMEVGDILLTFVPKFDEVPTKIVARLRQEKQTLSFLNLKEPTVRTVDTIWAEYLFGEEANNKLQEAIKLLSFLVSKRNP